MKPAILLAIRAYQRYLSPYKGFHCAFHAHTGRDTCSGYGYRVFARYGSIAGWRLLQRRFDACSKVARLHYSPLARPEHNIPNSLKTRQAGFVDCGGCDGCDVPDFSSGCDMLGDVADCAECGGRIRKARQSCGDDWDCADYLTALLVLVVVCLLLYLAYWHFFSAKP